MKKSVCKLCNRRYNYKYSMFGRGCLNTEYELLNVQKPEKIDDRELYLCNKVANRLLKVGLSRKKKYLLTEKYLTVQYLDRIKYGNLEKEKALLNQEIQNISFISTVASPLTPISLNNAYRLYNTTQKFDKKLKEVKRIIDKNMLEQLTEDLIINGMQFAFNKVKKKDPLMYRIYYYMQYEFWRVVMLGGLLVNFKLSAKLMEHSLGDIDYKPNDITINEPEFIENIKKNQAFKDKLRGLLDKYGKNKNTFELNEHTVKKDAYDDLIIEFSNDYDLFLSLHKGTLNVIAKKNDKGKWELAVTIKDTYDFTDLKNAEEIYDSGNSPLRAIGLILNNYGVVSMSYGVLKEYDVTVNLTISEDEL